MVLRGKNLVRLIIMVKLLKQEEKMLKRIAMACVLFVMCIPVVSAEVGKVNKKDESKWLRHLLPLPHSISIKKKNTLSPDDIAITLRKNAGDIEKQAASELKQLFKEKAGVVPSGKAFEIVIGVVDSRGRVRGIPVDNISRLEELPNKEQAYIIQPQGNDRLILTGLDERGVYYAVRTLHQLLEPVITKNSVTIPLADVLDWPDMEERGLWNYPRDWMPWFASLKFNYGSMGSTIMKIERGKPNHAKIDTVLLHESRLRALNCLPDITHLNFLHRHGLFQAYPELAGVGDGALAGRYFAHKQGNQHRVPCASNPLLTTILAEWMMDLASQGANEIGCWLSERPAQCGCKECTAVGQFVLEARAFVNAWRETRKTYPDFLIRLFISTTTSERYYRVLEETPPEIKIERACVNELERVRHLPRDLIRNPLLDHYTAQGRWIASYDVPIGAFGNVETPEYKVPESSAHRIRDYVEQLISRNYKGAYGMMGWGRMGKEICGFNIAAHAEWSWNLHGRSEREFAIAWATREAYENPEDVGEWSELLGPVEFDIYDSDFPMCYSWGWATQMIRERKRPYLGEGIFRYYTSTEDFDRKIAACEKALEIAGSFKDQYLAHETKVVLSYVKMAKYIYEVAEQVATDDFRTPGSQEKLRESLQNLTKAGEENVSAVKEWRGALGPEPWHYRVYDAIKGTETTVQEISQFVEGSYFY